MATTPAIPVALESKITHVLAMELARGLRAPADVLKDHAISKQEWDILKEHPHFMQLYKEAKQYWHSSENAIDRIKAVSGAMTEESLLPVFQLAHNEEIHPSTRLEAVKLLAKLSGADPSTQRAAGGFGGGGGGERFSITINLGEAEESAKNITIDAAPLGDGADPKPVDG